MRMVMYRCEDEDCFTAFAIEEVNEKALPYCPVCGNDETTDTAELIEGQIKPDNRDW